MGRYASVEASKEFEQVPPGSYMAICTRVVDLGTQHESFEGKEMFRPKLWVQWELPEEMMSSGEPFVTSSFYTFSLHEKSKLYQTLVSWRGKEFSPEEAARFDMAQILGKPCLLSVIHNDAGKARVQSVMRLPKGMTAPKPHNEVWALWLNPEDFQRENFDRLSEGIQNIIRKSPEWAKLQGDAPAQATQQELEDDVPF